METNKKLFEDIKYAAQLLAFCCVLLLLLLIMTPLIGLIGVMILAYAFISGGVKQTVKDLKKGFSQTFNRNESEKANSDTIDV
jgi:hypothetical protein